MQVYNINKVYKISLITIFIIGIFLRLFLLFQNNSMFYDEVVLMLNILNKRYIELLGHLDYYQVAPPLFLLATKLLVNIFKTSNLYLQDLIPKLIPFISGILSILAFYKFINLVNKNKFFIFISMFLFLFNPIIINYSVICKQYSIELLVSIILLSIFWRLIFDNISKSKYYIFIAFAPWLSFSSLFIIIPLSILLLFRNKKFFKNTIFSFSLSFVIYYVLYLQNILKQSYSGLNFCWASGGYFDFTHPTRLPIRLGALYSDEKSLALFCGCILLFALCLYLFSKNSILKKVYFLLPIIFTLLASAFHYYPLLARLLLFLVPIFIIFISMSNRFIILGFCTISLITSFYYIKNPISTPPVYIFTSARDVAKFVRENINEKHTIMIEDVDSYTYNYYFSDIKNNKIVLPYVCSRNIESCKNYVKNLPKGDYCFISVYKINKNEFIPQKEIEKSIFKNSAAIFFKHL